ncbi:Ent-kaurene oxidase 12 [Colletotrichum chlorophyti]|uniref:Ent-kaurene oxidase 12 n=1 Tax=Colletotrichum chlorophyti TaxID=708187 RepID=A0A1Q8RX99_9PEZI|nr:Ent-kaurene oxidase 12 [Colletotrichum chlorophyti]
MSGTFEAIHIAKMPSLLSFSSIPVHGYTSAGLVIIIIVPVILIISLVAFNLRCKSIPIVGNETDPDFRSALQEGQRKHPDKPFYLHSKPKIAILPLSWLNKLKSARESQLSARKEVMRRGLGQYTDLGTSLPEFFTAIKIDLTRHVQDLIPLLQEEIDYAFNHFLPHEETYQGWMKLCGFVFAKKVVVMLNAFAFVGQDLSRNQTWHETAYHYSDDLLAAFRSLYRWPFWLRPFVHPFIFERVGLSERRRKVAQMLAPLMRSEKCGIRLLDFVNTRLPSSRQDDVEFMARVQLRAVLASSDTVSQVVVNALYDLAARPEYVEPLREELESLIPEDGVWNMKMIRSLTKMDSFIKESTRTSCPYLGKIEIIRSMKVSGHHNNVSKLPMVVSPLRLCI